MRKLRMILFGTVVLLGLTACSGLGDKTQDKEKALDIVGSDTLLELIQKEAEAFYTAKATPVNVSGGGSGVGINTLIQGDASVANMSRDITEKEIAMAKESGVNLKAIPVAKDLLTIITHKSNPVTSLTIEQLAGIYKGTITNWSSVGGKDVLISLYGRHSSSGTYTFFDELVLKGEMFSSSVKQMIGNPQLLQSVMVDEGAIAYVGMGYVMQQEKNINVISINGINPLKVKDLTQYKLARFLYEVVNVNNITANTRAWLDFVLSSEGQAIVSQVGFLPLTAQDLQAITY